MPAEGYTEHLGLNRTAHVLGGPRDSDRVLHTDLARFERFLRRLELGQLPRELHVLVSREPGQLAWNVPARSETVLAVEALDTPRTLRFQAIDDAPEWP